MNIFQRFKATVKTVFGKSTLSLVASRSWNQIAMSQTEALRTFETNTLVYAAIKKRAEKVGQINFQLFRGEKEITDDPVLSVLNRPNKNQSKSEFFELYQTMKDLTGSVFVWKFGSNSKGVPEQLFLLRSDKMRVVTNSEGDITEFQYMMGDKKAAVFKSEDIIFSQHASPLNFEKFGGLPMPRPGTRAIRAYEQIDDYQANVINNGGKVEGILKIPADNLTKEQIQELRESWSKEYATATKAGTPFISYGGMEYEDIGLSPKELSFGQSKKDLRDDISMLFGVPKVLLAQTEDVNYGSAEVAHMIFLRETIKPLLDNLVDKLNYGMVPDELDLKYIDPTPDNIDQKLKIAESGLNTGWMKINEVRALFNLEPVPNGDDVLIGMGKIPLNFVTEPQPMDTPIEDTPTKSKSVGHPLAVKAVRDVYRKLAKAKQERWEKRFLATVRKYADDQKERVLQSVGKSWKKKDIIDEAFNEGLELKLGEEIFKPLMYKIAEMAGKDTTDLVSQSGKFKLSDALKSTLDKRAHFFVREINHTTYQQLKRVFATNLENGGTRADLNKEIGKLYGNITKGRAMTIARTETHVASQQANFDAYRQAHIPTKIWVTVSDDRTRDSHAEMDGQEVPIDTRFSNGLMFPGDPNGSADETINCRCSG